MLICTADKFNVVVKKIRIIYYLYKMEKRTCPECGEIIKGRIDKKFCSDMCRNAFNNKVNSDTTNYVRNINNILRRNRRVLEENLQGEKTTLSKQKLIDKGWIHFLGSDCHNLQHIQLLEETRNTKYFQKAISLPLLNNSL